MNIKDMKIDWSYGLGFNPVSLYIDLGTVIRLETIHSISEEIKKHSIFDLIFYGDIIDTHKYLFDHLIMNNYFVSILTTLDVLFDNGRNIVQGGPILFKNKNIELLQEKDLIVITKDLILCRKLYIRSQIPAQLVFSADSISTKHILDSGIHDVGFIRNFKDFEG